MLKIKYIVPVLALALSAVAALFFAACQPEDLNSDLPKGAIRLVAPGYQSPDGSKLGVDEEGKNVFFAVGDLLWVNGVQCPISVNENGVAYFVRPESVGYPLRIVYPYGIVDNNAPTNSDNIPITLPAEYTYATVQDGPGRGRQNVPAPLCAKIVGTGEGQKPNSAFFKHITAAITVAIENKTGAPMELEKIVVKSDYFYLHGSNTINVEDPAMNGVEGNLNNTGSDALSVSFSPECICRIENNDRAYIQIPILAQYNPVNSNHKAKLTIGVLAQNKLPGVIANKFYFEKTQGTAFNILQGQLAYAPAYFDINMPDDDPNYGLLVDGTYTIGRDANDKPLKVYLAKGNLQYAAGTVNNSTNTNYNTANTLGNPDPTDAGNWSFMSSQHLKIENFTHNQNQITRERSCSNVYGNGFISQFLYGSTGNNYNNIYTCHPIATPFALRQLTGHPQNDLFRSNNTDWGVRIGEKWFTLSSAQWTTLIGRTLVNKAGRTCQDRGATASGQTGLILYPDKYGVTTNLLAKFGLPFTDGTATENGQEVSFTYQMENAGVAFLPHAGYINVKTQNFKNGNKIISQESNAMNAMNSGARYWTSTGIYYLSVSTTTVSVAEASSYGTVANNTFTALVRLAYPANF